MDPLRTALDREAGGTGFSGVVRVDRPGTAPLLAAYGLADRAHEVPMTTEHQLGTASLTKGLTAVTVVSLMADGLLEPTTTARSVLGADLPAIRDDVTLEHLLSHRSGIGDYLDEDQIDDVADYLMPVPVHRLATSDDYLAILDGLPTVAEPGAAFTYNNGGFVVLAIIAERVASMPFHELVVTRVCDPAGMAGTRFLRSDELPGTAATGYLYGDGLRTNVLHLPVRGSGDGGAYTTAGDVRALWTALFDGALLPERWVVEMLRPRTDPERDRLGYGLGLWRHASGLVELHGYDAGVSCRSIHDPATASTWTVLSNTSEGSGPIEGVLEADLPS
jgi:CubicO group peptidase (beta-lactamase class C family)